MVITHEMGLEALPGLDLARDADGYPDVEDMLSLVHRLTGAPATEFRVHVAGWNKWQVDERGPDRHAPIEHSGSSLREAVLAMLASRLEEAGFADPEQTPYRGRCELAEEAR